MKDPKQEAFDLVDQIQAAADDQGITHYGIADATGYQRTNVYRMLKGKYLPKLDTFITLLRAVGLKITLTKIKK